MLTMKRPPVGDLPLSPRELTGELLCVLGLMAAAAVLIFYWVKLPAIIPTHFDAAGHANGWGSKNSLLFLFALPIGFYVGLSVLQRYPNIYNYVVPITEENAQRQYLLARRLIGWLKLILVWLFAYMDWVICHLALALPVGPGVNLLFAFIVVLFAGVGVYLVLSIRAR